MSTKTKSPALTHSNIHNYLRLVASRHSLCLITVVYASHHASESSRQTTDKSNYLGKTIFDEF